MHLRGVLSIATLTAGLSLLWAPGCSDTAPSQGETGTGVALIVAPLDSAPLGIACYDFQVSTQTSTLWSRGDTTLTKDSGDTDTVCSDDYGNNNLGSVRFVGACDANSGADTDSVTDGVQNDVTLWFDGIYQKDSGGLYTPVTGWDDPCGATGCTIHVDCVPNADTPAEFNFTLVRGSSQGFFDIAVRFESMFCSSKLDTCYDGTKHVEQMFNADGSSAWTAVLGLSCTSPAGSDINLHYGQIAVTCADGTNEYTFLVDPTADGSQAVTDNGKTLHYTVSTSPTTVDCDDDGTPATCHGLFWDIAYNLDDLDGLGTCHLATSATATKGDGHFVNGLPTLTGTYPYIDVSADLTTGAGPFCQKNPLNGDGSHVVTAYHGEFADMVVAMCFSRTATSTSYTGNADCGVAPEPPEPGLVMAKFTQACNQTMDEKMLYGWANDTNNPVQCAPDEACVPGGSYWHGYCEKKTAPFCHNSAECTAARVLVTVARPEAAASMSAMYSWTNTYFGTGGTMPGTTGEVWFQPTQDLMFAENTVSIVVPAIAYDPNDDGGDPNIGAGAITAITDSMGNALDELTATNSAAATVLSDTYCDIPGGSNSGICHPRGEALACDPNAFNPTCPAGSYCEGIAGGGSGPGRCRAQSGPNVPCSMSAALYYPKQSQCQSGLQCAPDPTQANAWEAACRVPGDVGAPCNAMQYGDLQCKPELYCRQEAGDYATCAPRNPVGTRCYSSGGMNNNDWTGNCQKGLLCEPDYNQPNPNNPSEYLTFCADPGTGKADGDPCWTEQSSADQAVPCKGHCEPFEFSGLPQGGNNLGNDGICAADYGIGHRCLSPEAWNGSGLGDFCKPGLFCDLGAVPPDAMSSGMFPEGTCQPIAVIGTWCDPQADMQNGTGDIHCAAGEVCGGQDYPLLNPMNERSYCVPAGCGNRVLEAGEQCDDGEYNCDTMVGNQHTCACSTTCQLNMGP